MKFYERVYDTVWHYAFHLRHWFELRFTNRYKKGARK